MDGRYRLTEQGEIIAAELKALLAGKRPKYILNPDTLDSFAWTGKRRTDEAALRSRAAAPGPGATDLDASAQRSKVVETKIKDLPAAAGQERHGANRESHRPHPSCSAYAARTAAEVRARAPWARVVETGLHKMVELGFDGELRGEQADFRPLLPLRFCW